MPLSEAKKKANKKYNDNKRKTFTVSLNLKEYELLDNYCKTNNLSRSGLVKTRIGDIINPNN